MTTITQRPEKTGTLRAGSALMALAGLAFIGYAVIFFVRNFTGAFLELGIGPRQVDVGRTEIRGVQPPAVPLHRAPAHRDLGVHRRHRTGHRGTGLVRGTARRTVGLRDRNRRTGARARRRATRPLPVPPRHPRPPWAYLPGDGGVRGGSRPRTQADTEIASHHRSLMAVPAKAEAARPYGRAMEDSSGPRGWADLSGLQRDHTGGPTSGRGCTAVSHVTSATHPAATSTPMSRAPRWRPHAHRWPT